MAATAPRSDVVETADGSIHVLHWGDGDPQRPAALLVHGTGHCASVWTGVAAELAATFEVYAVDRRGHGASTKPADAYDFTDFAGDAVAVIDALGLDGAFGIGHSAGGTDLLLAAPQRPHAFRRLLVIEPTVMDPDDPDAQRAAAAEHRAALDGMTRRRAEFAGRAEALARYDGRGFFAGWRPDVLAAYVRDGFDDRADGTVSLRCAPEREWRMVTHISAAMHGEYRRGDPGNPFGALRRIDCPTMLIATEHSQPIYGQMASTAAEMIPGSSSRLLTGVGHAVPMTAPERIAALALELWRS